MRVSGTIRRQIADHDIPLASNEDGHGHQTKGLWLTSSATSSAADDRVLTQAALQQLLLSLRRCSEDGARHHLEISGRPTRPRRFICTSFTLGQELEDRPVIDGSVTD